MKDRSQLTTERPNAASADIDAKTTRQIVGIINAEDHRIAPALKRELDAIAAAVDLIAAAFRAGGRLFYVGAGTSGRLGVLDASECPPTYGVRPRLVQGVIAGGRRALVRSVEGAEDRADEGDAAMKKRRVGRNDVVVGIAACGLTPFVHAALAQARKQGAKTAFITCAPQARRHITADVIINPVVGPEVVTGSTRMKAGTATKLALNMLTTAAMIRIGKVHGNLMVDLRATNAKLRDRAERIVVAASGVSRAKARALLKAANGAVKPAIVMHRLGVGLSEARKQLRRHHDSLRNTLRNKP